MGGGAGATMVRELAGVWVAWCRYCLARRSFALPTREQAEQNALSRGWMVESTGRHHPGDVCAACMEARAVQAST